MAGARKSKPKAKARSTPAIPPGFRTLTPYLCVDGGARAMEFYKSAFGAKELLRQAMPDGKVVHGRLQIGDSVLLLSDFFPGSSLVAPTVAGKSTVTIHVYAKDAQALWNRAVGAGATVLMPIARQFWGELYGQLRDPFGHIWSLSQQVTMPPAERERLQQQAMAMFASGEHPG